MINIKEARCDYLKYELIPGTDSWPHDRIKIILMPSENTVIFNCATSSSIQIRDNDFYLDETPTPTHGTTFISLDGKTGKPPTISLKIGDTTLVWRLGVSYSMTDRLFFNKTYDHEMTGILPITTSTQMFSKEKVQRLKKLYIEKLPLVTPTLEELSLRTIDALVKKCESGSVNSKDQIGLTQEICKMIIFHQEQFSK
jgi:hypothetical protein